MTKEKRPPLWIEIYNYIKSKRGQKVHNGDIQMFGQSLGYLPSNADRRGRDLVEPIRKRNGKVEPNPLYCPDIRSTKENGCAVYWWEGEDRMVTTVTRTPSNYRCVKCGEDAATFLDSKPVCQAHSVREIAPSLF
jgi:hypothetical protein